ncbi:hypothetical protein GQX74_013860 [Glossina fuscipes]|nr:hypothetical protein GQX74_013860 [Glossina fuscipes]
MVFPNKLHYITETPFQPGLTTAWLEPLKRSVHFVDGFVIHFVKTHEKPNDEKRALVQNKLSGSLEGILDLVPGCKSSVLGMLLETLTTIITVLLLQNSHFSIFLN